MGGWKLEHAEGIKLLDGCNYTTVPGCDDEQCDGLDVVFVLDTSSSMLGIFTQVQAFAREIVDAIERGTTCDYRIGIVTYRDDYQAVFGRRFNVELMMAIGNGASAVAILSALVADGGFAFPEPSDLALEFTVADGAGVWRGGNIAKHIVHLTDACPAGDNDDFDVGIDDQRAYDAATDAAARQIKIHNIVNPSRILEYTCGGVWEQVSSLSGGVYTEQFTAQSIIDVLGQVCTGVATSATDDCCRLIPCELCLTLHDDYGEVLAGGIAAWDGEQYTGSVGGHSFVALWRKVCVATGGYADFEKQCQLEVDIDGQLVSVFVRCESSESTEITCVDPHGTVGVPDGYGGGTGETIVFTKRLLVPLKPFEGVDYDGQACREPFCGDCWCVTDQLCVRLLRGGCVYEGFLTLEYPYGYDPKCPLGRVVWSGEVIEFGFADGCDRYPIAISVQMSRDYYTGECVLSATVDGDAHTGVLRNCLNDTVSIDLGYDDVLIINPATCNKCRPDGSPFCCEHSWDFSSEHTGSLVAGGGPCTVEEMTASGAPPYNGSEIAVEDRVWLETDVVSGFDFTYDRSPDPPDCNETCPVLTCYICQVPIDGARHPAIRDDILPCEWYLAIYRCNVLSTIIYDYAISCCGDVFTPGLPLQWIEFYGSGAAGAAGEVYNFRFDNVERTCENELTR